MGFSLRLDTVPGNSNGDHRSGRGWLRSLSWRAVPRNFADDLDHPTGCTLVQIRDKPVRAATCCVRIGKLIQNIFTSAKTLALLGLIFICVFIGRNAAAISDNFGHFWAIRGAQPLEPGAGFLRGLVPTVTAASGAFGLFVAYGVAQVGSLFSADAWNNIGFTAAEVKNPKRDVALSMAFGTLIVITLYCLANLAYLCTLPLAQIQNALDDRVASAALAAVFGPAGAAIMAVAIIISTFGCNNGLILAGARVSYAMARDGLFFKSTGTLNQKGVPGSALIYQGRIG